MRKLLREKWRRIVFLILMSLCIIPDTDMQPILSPAQALFAGIVVANTMGFLCLIGAVYFIFKK